MTLFPDGGSAPQPPSVLQSHARGMCYGTAAKRPRLSFVFHEVVRTLTIGMTNVTALIGSLQGASSEHRAFFHHLPICLS